MPDTTTKFDRRVNAAMASKNPKTRIKLLLNAAQIWKDALKGS